MAGSIPRAVFMMALLGLCFMAPFARGQEARSDARVDIEIQKQALFALSQSSSEESLTRLIEVAETHPQREVRKQAIFWLSQRHSDASIEALERIAEQSDDIEIQKQVLFAYSQLPGNDAVHRLIRVAVRHPEREMREQAIFWLGQRGGEEVVEIFEEILADKSAHPDVQKKVVFSYSQMPHDQALPRLIEIARSHDNVEVRKQAIFWLGQTNDPRAREALLDIVKG